MFHIRALLHTRHATAMFLIALALMAKALVPPGYMLGSNEGARTITVQLCADTAASSTTITIPIAGETDGQGKHHKAAESPCAFTALSDASLASVSPVLLADALEYIITLGFAPVSVPALQGFFHLRPPLRGPPALS